MTFAANNIVTCCGRLGRNLGETKRSRRFALERTRRDENVFRAVPRVVADQEACKDKDTSLQGERKNGILEGRADDGIGKETGGRGNGGR